jgi:hypothetical protein
MILKGIGQARPSIYPHVLSTRKFALRLPRQLSSVNAAATLFLHASGVLWTRLKAKKIKVFEGFISG